jgi:hypothetical protein
MEVPRLKPKPISVLRPVSGAEALARARRLIEAAAPSIVRVLIDAAHGGDINAARILLDRVLPVARSACIQEPIELSGSPAQQCEQIKAAVASGRLTLEAAETMIAIIESTQRVTDAVQMVERIAQLEHQLAALAAPVRAGVIDVQAEDAARSLPAPRANGGSDEF